MQDKIMEIARECDKNEYCTHCGFRTECLIRISFYLLSEHAYRERMKQQSIKFMAILISMGYTYEEAVTGCAKWVEERDKKRNRELEEHPVYSGK